jgi:hypothetical protein
MSTVGYGYGQYGVGPYGLDIISRSLLGNCTISVGQSSQLTVVDTYSDGTQSSVVGTWASSNLSVVFVSNSGLILGVNSGSATITVSDPNSAFIIGTVTVIVQPLSSGIQSSYIQIPTFLSHVTQVLQNYFDYKDSRIRRGKYTLDAQLLNLAAQQMQLSSLRLEREIDATTLHSCPANIDNGGCYWKQALPSSFNFSLPTHTVVGTRSSVPLLLTPYLDELPIPTRITLNSSFSPVPLNNPLLFSATGLGNSSPQYQDWACQRFGPFTPAFANKIHLWVDGIGYALNSGMDYASLNIQVKITGQRGPMPVWSNSMVTTSETIDINNVGWACSNFPWSYIKQIQILGLPAGVTLNAYVGMFSLPKQPDLTRPHTDSEFRGVTFNRYWTNEIPSYLTEQYLESNYEGYRYIQAYNIPGPISGIAVEPNTWGMFIASGTTLYYVDRREPLPSNLSSSAITQEPYYGLDISIDELNIYPIKYANLTPVPYAYAADITAYRYLVNTPDGNKYIITSSGVFADYSNNSGWCSTNSAPPSLKIPLGYSGTYVFTLQTIGTDFNGAITYDSMPCPNFSMQPLATLDLSSLVPQIQGLSFDDRNRLWVWTGTQAIAVQLHYDAYLLDQPTWSIYLTDSVDSLTIDGTSL